MADQPARSADTVRAIRAVIDGLDPADLADALAAGDPIALAVEEISRLAVANDLAQDS